MVARPRNHLDLLSKPGTGNSAGLLLFKATVEAQRQDARKRALEVHAQGTGVRHKNDLIEAGHLIAHRPGRHAVRDRIDELAQTTLDPRELVPGIGVAGGCCGAETSRLALELVGERREQLGVHEAVLEPVENRGLQHVAPDVEPVIAGPLSRAGAQPNRLALIFV